jgi:S-adenosylmethionine hydrolase
MSSDKYFYSDNNSYVETLREISNRDYLKDAAQQHTEKMSCEERHKNEDYMCEKIWTVDSNGKAICNIVNAIKTHRCHNKEKEICVNPNFNNYDRDYTFEFNKDYSREDTNSIIDNHNHDRSYDRDYEFQCNIENNTTYEFNK